jgi:multidrug resistance efflux pump
MTGPERPILEPDDQFIDALEQQLRDDMRRRARLADVPHQDHGTRRGGRRMFLTPMLMFVSLLIGATGTFAVVQSGASPHRELHVQRATILLEQAQVRLEHARADLVRMRELAEQGAVQLQTVAAREATAARAALVVQRRALDLEESEASGRAPDDRLSGPRVAGRDFVTERLELDLEAARIDFEEARANASRVRELVNSGVVSMTELAPAVQEEASLERAVAGVQHRLELRAAYLRGEMDAETAELEAMLGRAEQALQERQEQIEIERNRLQRMQMLHEQGTVNIAEVRAAELAVRSAEAAIELAGLDLRIIRDRLGDPAGE